MSKTDRGKLPQGGFMSAVGSTTKVLVCGLIAAVAVTITTGILLILGLAICAVLGREIPTSWGDWVLLSYGAMVVSPILALYFFAWCVDTYRAYRKPVVEKDWADEQN